MTDFQLIIKNELSNIDLVNDQFTAFAHGKDVPKNVVNAVCMVFDDMLTNIITYAYQDDGQHDISIQVLLKRDYNQYINYIHLPTWDS